ncbi:hypothetical protein BUALT_Bualt11G0043100 [Buddleja alternifolia]|uniref:Cell cycle checkpoint protein RAD17 n=1 Tax=Buddleja alternifolia TaxID=168488 RepID=A0AAV6WSH6_9LAMI|nr:hypothetical protein BUALT_Bualt11G0043100 [Buddleja alternifolia]
MGKGKRNSGILISSSDDEEEDKDLPLKNNFRSAPTRKNPKRAKRVSISTSSSQHSASNGFDEELLLNDLLREKVQFVLRIKSNILPGQRAYVNSVKQEVKRFCEEFDQGFTQFKVTSGFGSNKDLWVQKYKPSLAELAVHKKKVEEVKMWFEERLRNSRDGSCSNVIIISGQAGVGKSATIHAIACHLGAELCEWNTPTPTIWQEHLHNSNSGICYMSKLEEFESFVERIRKYGLVSSSLTRESPKSIILLIDDLPVVNGKVSYGRLQRCLHLLLQSVRLPTAILINDYGKSESTDHNSRYSEELQLSLQNAGACKVTFNPITVNSIRRILSKICRLEELEVSDEQIDIIAKSSGGDIRHAITSLQYFSLKPNPMQSLPVLKRLSTYPEGKGNESSHLDNKYSLPYGKDATLSLFHALGKFLHNKRETVNLVSSDRDAMLLKEKFVRCPLKMENPELILSQAHGQARLIADFLHENVLDFVKEEAIEDAWIVATYLGDTDLLLGSLSGALCRNFEAENVIQSTAASIAARGVLFGNTSPVSSRWHAIRRPKLWEAEQSMWCNKYGMVTERRDVHSNINLSKLSVLATEFKPALKWLGHRVDEDVEGEQVRNEDDGMSLDEEDDEIEEW